MNYVASLDALSHSRKMINEVFNSLEIDNGLKNSVLLCLSEWLTNSIKHTNSNRVMVELERSSSGDTIQMIIKDDSTLNFSLKDKVPYFEKLSESGRGLFIINNSCDEFVINDDKYGIGIEAQFKWKCVDIDARPIILVVEDDKALAALYRSYLQDDYQIRCAENGIEAIEIIEKLKKNDVIDAIVSDISMPKMDGLDLKERLTQYPNIASTPFIFLTSSDNGQNSDRANKLGFDDYLIKPVQREQLLSCLQRVRSRFSQLKNIFCYKLNKSISQSLIPDIPSHIGHWRLSGAFRNTGIGGGDHLIVDGNNLLMMDVMGHNQEAKFFAHAYCGYLRGLMSNHREDSDISLSRFMTHASKHIYKDQLLNQSLVTLCAINFKDDGFSVCGAGHPKPLKITNQSVEEIELGLGSIPGLLEETEYEETYIPSHRDYPERYVIYTDGLFEAVSSIETMHALKDKLYSLFTATMPLDIEIAVNCIMESFDLSVGANPLDDVSLLMFERDI